MTEFEERPRKVHLFHDQEGKTYADGKRMYADTLCCGNWRGPGVITTTDPKLVTCKICRHDARFRVALAAKAVEAHDRNVVSAPSPVERPGRRTRYRVTRWSRKLVLQVEYEHTFHASEDEDMPQTAMRWRDATLEDLGRGVV